MENLENIIESVLFVAGNAVPISDLCIKFNVDKKEINKAVKKLQEKYDGKSGIKLQVFNNNLQFSSNSDYVEYIAAVLNPIRQRNLTKATLETAAIIAYKQPITRTEIEETRGVNSDYALNILLEHKLVEVVGRKDAVGRPSLFGTTDEFLKRFGISSIDELPDYNELMQKIQSLRANYSGNLFNRFEPVLPNEEDMDKKLEDFSKVNDENLKFAETTSESVVIGEEKIVKNQASEDFMPSSEEIKVIDEKLAKLSGDTDVKETSQLNNVNEPVETELSGNFNSTVTEDDTFDNSRLVEETELDKKISELSSSDELDLDYFDMKLAELSKVKSSFSDELKSSDVL